MGPGTDPRSYVDRYGSDRRHREWFDEYHPGVAIHEAVGLPEPAAARPAEDPGAAGPAGVQAAQAPAAPAAAQPPGGGCLIATAAYGTEPAPQVQRLREARGAAPFAGGPAPG